MKFTIEEVGQEKEEEIIFRCHEVNENILNLLKSIKAATNGLTGIRNGEIHKISLSDVFYFEVVENKSFIYCNDAVYESKLKLYEFENICKDTSFFRASKSVILNSDKIESIVPSLSGRFEVRLFNSERVVVSRQYVSVLKKMIGI